MEQSGVKVYRGGYPAQRRKYLPKYVTSHTFSVFDQDNFSDPFCNKVRNYSVDDLPHLLRDSEEQNKKLDDARHAERMNQIRDKKLNDGKPMVKRQLAARNSKRYGATPHQKNSSILEMMGVAALIEYFTTALGSENKKMPCSNWIAILSAVFLLLIIAAVGGTRMYYKR